MTLPVALTVNGTPVSAEVEPRVTLLDFVRDELGLTSVHGGCEQGACGTCTVLLDGEAVRSCLVLAVGVRGSDVTTVEGVGDLDALHPVQAAIWRHHGLQCGFCTPGMVLTAIDLLERIPNPTEEQVRAALSGNLCRCTGYSTLVAAIVEVGAMGQVNGTGAHR